MTAVNYYIPSEDFAELSKNPDPQAYLTKLREKHLAPAIVGTPDMRVGDEEQGYEQLDLTTVEGKKQAGKVMDLNVLMFGNKSRKKTLYVPKSIFDQVGYSVNKVGELLRGTTQTPICIKPMISDKDIYMLRSIGTGQQELSDDAGRIKDTFESEFGKNDEAIYEGIIIPERRAVVSDTRIVLEGYNTPHRIDTSGDFQRIMRENAPIVDGMIRGLEGKSDSPVLFNFSAPENFKYA